MAPKRNARESTPSSTATTQVSTPATAPVPAKVSTKSSSSNQSPQDIALGIWQNYLDATPQRTKLIDTFMVFLMAVGVLQFVYCVIVGNYVRLARYGQREELLT
jgi:oligosaccharyltransferase complex subunit epsilon